MSKEYVTQVGGAYRISGTHVSLDSVVYAWLEGLSPESIVESYPALTLEQVKTCRIMDQDPISG